MSREITMTDLNLINGEARVQDLALAEALGFSQVRPIRKLIERNLAELGTFGPCAAVARVVRGNPVTEYHLNEAQALLVCMFSRTERAAAVRRSLIEVYAAWRRGQTAPSNDLVKRVESLERIMIKRWAGDNLTQEMQALELATCIESRAEEDGMSLGPTDLELCVRALRALGKPAASVPAPSRRRKLQSCTSRLPKVA